MKKPIIVFDLDGTLVDTAPDLLASLNHSLEAGGLAMTDATGFRSYVGNGGRVMIERAYAAQRKPLAPDEHDRLYAVFLDHYGTHMPGGSKPYPGVMKAIQKLQQAGFLVAICTNKTEALARQLLAALGIADQFAAICGQDSFAMRKPDPRALINTIELAGGDAERAVMIGDSRTDIDTAKAAGIPVVAVDFGYTDRHVREFEPSKIISHFDQLTVELVQGLMASALGKTA
ncbi:phosphoglycolate phosphatase [Mesorhizobium sp. NBSH29]|uniref:phosphoglycolate phosphatase n=1 Tax=Mesorhizobium sp. NBSH29 TaxID=2654249 RepID=UPI0018969449|nr:phosphoglycolate phosphatase [Mesorhizobium sp. NBSH29]QPC87979.1 phosphoglycolate phosphatase [Mesorhizobium sp. NBSH29]